MNQHITTTASVLLAFSLAGASLAGDFGPPQGGPPRGPGQDGTGGPGGGPPPGGMEQAALARIVNNPKIAEELGLTEDQVKTLRNGIFDAQEQKVKLKAEMEVAAIQQARLLTADPVDEKAVMAAVEKAGGIRTEIAKLEMKGLLLVRNTLNAEQREKVREMIHRHMMRQGQGPGGREGRGGDRQRGGQERGENERRGRGDGPQQDAPPPPPEAGEPAE